MRNVLCLVAVLLIAGGSFGAISVINVEEVQGYQASYDHTTQTITWSGGASATLYKDDGSTLPISSVDVSATIQELEDFSADGWAHGIFSVVNWRIDLLHQGNNDYAGFIEGTQLSTNTFEEIEGAENPSPFGPDSGIVVVTDYDFTYWGNSVWADVSGGAAGLTSHNVLGQPQDPDQFGSYLTDDYATSETTMWLYADESAIPEPATMALLGLGALLLRKRKV
jgi:hypothetical protein